MIFSLLNSQGKLIMRLQSLFLVFALCFLAGCASESPIIQEADQRPLDADKQAVHELSELQKSLDAKYTHALETWQEKIEPISAYITSVCRAKKKDKDYVACLKTKDNDLIEAHFFPELQKKTLQAREEYQQQLLSKKITRDAFMKEVGELHNKLLLEMQVQVENDLKASVYSGKY